MLKVGSLNLLCGGPSAGKTTLVYQAVLAHERNEPFFVSSLRFPSGPILVIGTDRNRETNDQFFNSLGIQKTEFISVVEDTELHNLSNSTRNETHGLDQFRTAIGNRIAKLPFHPSTVILDLYGDFINSSSANLKALGYQGRSNVRWASQMKVAILGLAYPFKQKATNHALRVQDRIAGALSLQASADWKFNITDKAETKTCWIVDAIPPPMGGKPQTYYGMRQNDPDGVGRFEPCEAPYDVDDVDTLMERYGVERSQASRILKRMREEQS